MADTATKTAAPRKPSTTRNRAPGTRVTNKKPTPAPEPEAQVAETVAEVIAEALEEAESTATTIALLPHPDGPTKRYSKWLIPAGPHGCQGNVYAAPHATSVTLTVE